MMKQLFFSRKKLFYVFFAKIVLNKLNMINQLKQREDLNNCLEKLDCLAGLLFSLDFIIWNQIGE